MKKTQLTLSKSNQRNQNQGPHFNEPKQTNLHWKLGIVVVRPRPRIRLKTKHDLNKKKFVSNQPKQIEIVTTNKETLITNPPQKENSTKSENEEQDKKTNPKKLEPQPLIDIDPQGMVIKDLKTCRETQEEFKGQEKSIFQNFLENRKKAILLECQQIDEFLLQFSHPSQRNQNDEKKIKSALKQVRFPLTSEDLMQIKNFTPDSSPRHSPPDSPSDGQNRSLNSSHQQELKEENDEEEDSEDMEQVARKLYFQKINALRRKTGAVVSRNRHIYSSLTEIDEWDVDGNGQAGNQHQQKKSQTNFIPGNPHLPVASLSFVSKSALAAKRTSI